MEKMATLITTAITLLNAR